MKSTILIFFISCIYCFGQQSKQDSIQFQEYWLYVKNNLENDLTSCDIIAKKMLKLSHKTKNSTHWIRSYVSTGWVYKIKNDIPKAKQAYRNAIHIADTSKSHVLYGGAIYCLGTLLRDEGKLDSVSIITYKALDKLLLLNKKNTNIEHKLNYRIAELEVRLKNYDKAINIYKGYLSEDNVKGNAYLHGCLGAIYLLKKEYQKAIEANIKSISEYKKITTGVENHNIAVIHLNLGETYLESKQIDLAEVNFKIALDILTKNDIDIGLGGLYYHLSKIESIKNNTIKEKEYLNKAIDLSKNNIDVLESAHFNLAILHAKNNDVENKNKHLKFYHEIKDSIFNHSRTKTIDELNTKYNTAKNKLKIKQLHERNANERRSKIIFLVFFIAISALLLLVLLLYKQRNKTLKLLHDNQIELKNKTLQNTISKLKNENIKSEIQNINIERNRIAKDLHESISGNLAAIKLKLTTQNHNNVLNSIITNIDDTYHEVRAISHNLIPKKFSNNSFNYLIEQLCKSPIKKVSCNVLLYPKEEIDFIKENIKIEVYKIIQEALNNVHKHAKATTIEVSITLHQNYLNIIIEDNGIGFSPNGITNGIGLMNIKERINDLNGSLIIDSKINHHTIINIEIPNAKKKYPNN